MTFLRQYNNSITINLKKICRNFIQRAEDPIVRALKLALIQILQNPEISIPESRSLVEKAFGIKRESLLVSKSPLNPPFLPQTSDKTYTLVLDLDETLVHYIEADNKGLYLSRPYAENFLSEMSKYYEIVVFTAAVQEYADWILDDFDNGRLIQHRL